MESGPPLKPLCAMPLRAVEGATQLEPVRKDFLCLVTEDWHKHLSRQVMPSNPEGCPVRVRPIPSELRRDNTVQVRVPYKTGQIQLSPDVHALCTLASRTLRCDVL